MAGTLILIPLRDSPLARLLTRRLSRLSMSQTRLATLFIASLARMFTAVDRVSAWHPVAWLPLERRRSARFGVDMRWIPTPVSSAPDE